LTHLERDKVLVGSKGGEGTEGDVSLRYICRGSCREKNKREGRGRMSPKKELGKVGGHGPTTQNTRPQPKRDYVGGPRGPEKKDQSTKKGRVAKDT